MKWADMTLHESLNRPLLMPRADGSTLPTSSCYITVSRPPPPGLCHLTAQRQEELYTLDALTSSSLGLATLPCMKYKMV